MQQSTTPQCDDATLLEAMEKRISPAIERIPSAKYER